MICLHQALILSAMSFVKAYHRLLRYAVASDRKPTACSYRTRAPSPVTLKGSVANRECAMTYQVFIKLVETCAITQQDNTMPAFRPDIGGPAQ